MAEKGNTSYSLMASMYGAWEEYKIPAFYYHYILAVLPHLNKKRQILLMSKEIKTLKANNHTYHRIVNAIEAREKSLSVIVNQIYILARYENTNQMEWPELHNLDIQDYKVVHEDERSPILSPRKQHKTALLELTNHLKMYQKVTLQIIYLIAQWVDEIKQMNYDGIVQFLFAKENYLLKINSDTNQTTSEYNHLFQNNPFFLMKKTHEKTQYALIYQKLKPEPELAKKIYECLKILSNHEAEVLRFKMLSKFGQKASKKNISKPNQVQKVYMNYNNGNDYYMIKDDEMKKSKIVPPLRKSQKKLKKDDIFINPEPNPIVDTTKRKHPVFVNLVESRNSYTVSEDDLLKRSNTDVQLGKKKHSMAVQPLHGKNSIFIETELDLTKNKGTDVQKKLQMLQQVDRATKYKSSSKQQRFDVSNIQPITHKEQIVQEKKESQKQEEFDELSEDNPISLIFDENIKETEVVKYLRKKVFHNTQVSFEEIQSVAKKLLKEKDQITFIRVQCRNLPIAWLAVKFIEKDKTMRRCVHIVYIRKFMRLSNFERKLLDSFVAHGYGLIRNEERILFEVNILDIVSRPLVKVKYKVNPYVDKDEIKRVMKKNKTIGQSRILKYHSYSKNTKYHQYCNHEKSNCSLSYNFLQICKITIGKTAYIKAKADKITKLGSELYKITSKINDTDLVIGRTLTDILQLEKENQIQRDSSFDSKCDTDYTHVAIKQGKLMRKYMDQNDQTIISQFITVNGNIPQVRSVSLNRQILPPGLLLIENPFFLAMMTKEGHQTKTLAVLEFE